MLLNWIKTRMKTKSTMNGNVLELRSVLKWPEYIFRFVCLFTTASNAVFKCSVRTVKNVWFPRSEIEQCWVKVFNLIRTNMLTCEVNKNNNKKMLNANNTEAAQHNIWIEALEKVTLKGSHPINARENYYGFAMSLPPSVGWFTLANLHFQLDL